MKTSYGQFYNYAKDMYKKSDNVMDDLKELISNRSLLYVEHISDGDVIGVLIDAVFEVVKEPQFIRRFMENLSPSSYYKYVKCNGMEHYCRPHPDYDYTTAVIGATMSVLRNTALYRMNKRNGEYEVIIDCDKPDANILELSDFGKKQLIEEKVAV
jgi:hypothetical protein